MNLKNYSGNILAPRDIRRYPTEVDLVPSFGVTKNPEVGRGPTFSEVAVGVNSANRVEARHAEPPAGNNGKPFALWEKDGFGLADLIDIINPVQHIPIVATIYRNLSGDQIGAAPRVIGGALWGRIGGFVTGVANALVEWWSGKDIGDHIYASMFGRGNQDPSPSPVAQTKLVLPDAVAGAISPADALMLRSAASTIMFAKPPATLFERDAGGPNTVRFETLPLPRAARNPYERNRSWDEPDESLGFRFPA